MAKVILGKKLGMTQIFTEEGKVVPVTVVESGKNVVLQSKTVETDGGKYKIKDENFEEYKKKVEEIENTEVNVKDLDITLDDVSKAQYTDSKEGWLTPIEIYKLDEFLKKQQKEKEGAE